MLQHYTQESLQSLIVASCKPFKEGMENINEDSFYIFNVSVLCIYIFALIKIAINKQSRAAEIDEKQPKKRASCFVTRLYTGG